MPKPQIYLGHGIAQFPHAWGTGGALATNPAANDILDTTGALTQGVYCFQFFMHATVAATFVIAHRNAANSADLVTAKEFPISASSELDTMWAIFVTVANNERILIRNKSGVTGDAQGRILFARVLG